MATGYVKVSSLELMGKKFDVYVTTGGHWHVVEAGQEPSYQASLAEGRQRDEVIERLKLRLRKDRTVLAIPFVYQNDYEIPKRGVGRGVHQTSREVLVTWADGTKDKLGRYSSHENTLADLSPDDWQELLRLVEAARNADANLKAVEKPLQAFLKQHHMDLRDALDKALNAEIVNTPELTVVEGGKE